MDINTLATLLEKLSGKVGVSVELLWESLIKQAYINGIIRFIVCMVVLGFSIGGLYFLRKLYNFNKKKYPKGSYICVIIVATAVLIIVCNIFNLGMSAFNITESFLNPEYWALKQMFCNTR